MSSHARAPEEGIIPSGAAERCEDVRCTTPSDRVFYCVDCSSCFCSSCWTFQTPHRQGKLGRDGQPHEKTNYHIAKRLERILNPPADQARLRQMHENDEQSTWFGMYHTRRTLCSKVLTHIGWAKDPYSGRPVLEDSGAYASLMADAGSEALIKYPQLVSFIGQTSSSTAPQ
jgi:hypothetical protein